MDARLVLPACLVWAVTASGPRWEWIWGAMSFAAGCAMVALLALGGHRAEAKEKYQPLLASIAACVIAVLSALAAQSLHNTYASASLHFHNEVERFLRSPLPAVASWVESRRGALIAAVSDYPQYAQGLIPGVVIGDDSALPSEIREMMRMEGLSHLTAVSGAHVSLALGLVIAACGRSRSKLTAAISGAVLIVLVALVGPAASVLRAGMMGMLMVGALAFRREASALPLVCVAVIGACLAFPMLATSLGFELSAACTLAIVLFAYPLSAQLQRVLPQWLALMISLPLVAGIASMPFLAGIQSRSSLWSVVANVAVAPAVAPLTICGFIAVLTLGWAPILAMPALWVCRRCAWWMNVVAEICARLPGSGVPLWRVGMANLLVASVFIVFSRARAAGLLEKIGLSEYLDKRADRVVAMLKKCSAKGVRMRPRSKGRYRGFKKQRRGFRELIVASLVVLVAIFALFVTKYQGWLRLPIFVGQVNSDWEAVQCDVGQGSALLLRGVGDDGELRTVLVDVGPANGHIGRCLRAAGVRKLDLLVLSHFDADHVRGLDEVLEYAKVKQAWVSSNPYPLYNSQWVLELLARQQIQVHAVTAGEDFGGWLSVLSPADPIGSEEEVNADSLVIRASTLHHNVLSLADVPSDIQDGLVQNAAAERVGVVIVAHHGAASQSQALANQLDPQVAIVSVGRNNYGHPSSEALRIWQAPVLAQTLACGWISVEAEAVSAQRACNLSGQDRIQGAHGE